ncbi:HD domain-containing protein [Marinomonas mediterranea]|uniref:HD domain-containing phosphohydrolase n=1 Tax=Marinomonas mediterranea TaxID=119864 RepID=UPI00234BC991|nr:HD domain-containing phosphohydrolase [Marinomonas mediterranea]WCN11560.1 HD domain-containing protein [Marinomonas mediterranea]
MIEKKRHSGIPLQVIVSSAIIISMLILAAGLTGVSYYLNRNTLIAEVEKKAVQVTNNLNHQIQQVTQSVDATVKLLEFDTITSMQTLETRKQRLPALARIMRLNHVLSAVYVGYNDGDFVLLRSLKNDHSKEVLSAPNNAEFMLQSIERDAAGNVIRTWWEFFDTDLNSISVSQPSSYLFDPRKRPWYRQANTQSSVALTAPYVFFSTLEIGTTFAIQNKTTGAVVGVDASIEDLSSFMKDLLPNKHTAMALVDQDGLVIGSPSDVSLIRYNIDTPRLITVDELGVPALDQLITQYAPSNSLAKMDINGSNWYGFFQSVINESDQNWRVLYSVPEKQLLEDVNEHLIHQLTLSGIIIGILVLFGWLIGRSISRPLLLLSEEVGALASFDFNRKISVASSVKEVNLLSSLTDHMALAIKNFQSITQELSRDPDLEKMLEQVSKHLVAITSSEAGAVYLCSDKAGVMTLATTTNMDAPKTVLCGTHDWSNMKTSLHKVLDDAEKRVFLAPLVDRDNSMLGALALRLPKESMAADNAFQRFMEEVSGAAATAISTRKQFESQQTLMEAIIRLLADAIDAKSPYTSGHCERVPVLAEKLVEAAIDSNDPEYANFSMTDTQKREFRIAAWLHDCGKITSPEHIVDKATKLETIHNRIHEIRTRFEILWRDAEIAYLSGLLEGREALSLEKAKIRTQRKLQDDFAFIARSNIGSELMAEEDIERIAAIGSQTWRRHFSSHIGLSREEMAQLPSTPDILPATEYLISDKSEHIIPWGIRRPAVEKDNPQNVWGFDMSIPKQALNKGELYSLSVKRGTLTNEERFAINDHIVQTIKMLSALPFPEDLKNVPNIAGNHHEKMDGTGYPRKLTKAQMSIPERIMAIADVFEALTAADRPYKTAKTLSESMRILAFMVKDNHLDKNLFKLFVTSKAYLAYAEKYLKPEQIDTVSQTQLFNWAGIEVDVVHPS